MLVVNEKSAQRISFTFKDIAGATAAPTTVVYAVHCVTTGAELLAFTAATPANPTLITITATLNAIQDARNSAEVRRVIVKANEGLADALTAQYDYEVANLTAIP